ncbi:unnamed protein product [Adineta ricciae]|uniref:LCCL domain-containing protein n=1 Tax=Adineta ricciae TaxID=249248 RepID=A0A814SZX9_ADIRI|nr:unnamed protein product [Adineta ricciae]CAF1152758.1 unnamed protein product [Adineta ricciae]
MSKIINSKFQCANTTCLPFVTNILSDIRQCKMNCLAQTYCRAISFHQLTSTCQLFDNIPNPNGNMLVDTNTITMIVIAGTRNPPEPTTTSTTSTSSTTTSTTSTSSSSTSTTSTTSTSTSTTTTSSSSTSSTPSTAPSTIPNVITGSGGPSTYRGNNGQYYSFSITGSLSGSVWGSDIYTDDSNLNAAAVHAGYAQNGVTTTVIIQILPGQSSYTSTTRNGVTTYNYGSWGGSYSVVGNSG